MKISFSPPYIDEDVIALVEDSLRSGWITSGPKVKALEEELEKRLGVESCVCVNSWTSGATLVLRWLGVKEGDEVIVPAYTYCATAMAVMDAGAKPVMVDINDEMTIDVEKIRQAITPRTKAVIPVDLGGWPCDYDKIRQIVECEEIRSMFVAESPVQEKLGRILILADSAHSVGAKLQGKNIAELADVCVLSFHAVKNITSAEGGAVCFSLEAFDNKAEKAWFKMMSLNGQTKDAFTKNQAGAWRYDIVAHGMKINMPDVNAAIALAQLRKYDYLLSERKRVYELYRKLLGEYHWAILPPKSSDRKQSAYHLFPLRIDSVSESKRDEIIAQMAQREIATNVHYIPMPCLTLFKQAGYKIEDYPKSLDTYKREITLPIYPQLSDLQVEYIVRNLVEVYYKVMNKD
jgi:dTDP-4-amino-4,6-dideoxygalactose transaminase